MLSLVNQLKQNSFVSMLWSTVSKAAKEAKRGYIYQNNMGEDHINMQIFK